MPSHMHYIECLWGKFWILAIPHRQPASLKPSEPHGQTNVEMINEIHYWCKPNANTKIAMYVTTWIWNMQITKKSPIRYYVTLECNEKFKTFGFYETHTDRDGDGHKKFTYFKKNGFFPVHKIIIITIIGNGMKQPWNFNSNEKCFQINWLLVFVGEQMAKCVQQWGMMEMLILPAQLIGASASDLTFYPWKTAISETSANHLLFSTSRNRNMYLSAADLDV